MSETLYDRLGGTEGITRIASDLVDNHLENPLIATRFVAGDVAGMKEAAATFFIAGTGGPTDAYKGKDLISAHKGMNISAEEFMAAMDDSLDALAKNNVPQRVQEEVLFILYSMRSQVLKL